MRLRSMRHFCTAGDRRRPRGDDSFYADEAVKRNYFYVVDNKGQIFLESERHRTMATCMKDAKFLKFLIANQQKNNTQNFADVPYLSRCGREINYISPVDKLCAVVFTDADWEKKFLLYGSTLKQPFDPRLLSISRSTFRLYHPISDHRFLSDEIGLLQSTLAQKLSERIKVNSISVGSSSTFDSYSLRWDDNLFSLRSID